MGTQPLAIQKCMNAGGYLAVISSVKERTAVQTNLRSMNHWIDGSDAVQEGIWKTYNGDTISEVPFQTPPLSGSIEPNGGIISNCLFLYYNRLGDDVSKVTRLFVSWILIDLTKGVAWITSLCFQCFKSDNIALAAILLISKHHNFVVDFLLAKKNNKQK